MALVVVLPLVVIELLQLTAAMEVPVGLLLRERSLRLDRAFGFASMVLNNNLLAEREQYVRSHKRLYPIARNRTDLNNSYRIGNTICSLFSEGVHVIVGTAHPSTYNTIRAYSTALHVPVILASTSGHEARDRDRYDVSVAPALTNAVIQTIAKLPAVQKVYYVYDNDDGMRRLERLYAVFQGRKGLRRTIEAYKIRDLADAHLTLRAFDMKDYAMKTVVLDLETTQAYRKVLEQVTGVGMNRDEYHYILAGSGAMDLSVDSDSDFFSRFLYGGVNITAFSFVANESRTYKAWEQQWRKYQQEFPGLFPLKSDTALMIDAVRTAYEAVQTSRILPAAPRGRAPSPAHCRLDSHPQPSMAGDQILDSIGRVNFSGVSGPVSFQDQRRLDYRISVYQLGLKQPMTKVATLGPADLTLDSLQQEAPPLMSPNATQRVTTVLEPPFVSVVGTVDGEPAVKGRQYEGYCIDLLQQLADRVGFQYSLHVQKGYGNVVNGSWTGMMGLLVRKERDIAVAPLTITKDRERVVDFTKPFMSTGISIMIKKPDRQKPGVLSFMDPFHHLVWLCIAIGFLAVSFVLFVVGRFSPYEWQTPGEKEGGEGGDKGDSATNAFTISNTLWFSLGALMQQGSDVSPRSLSGRIIGCVWWFFTLIIISSYTANLAAFLTIEKLVSPIDSADDLVEHPTIKYGTLGTGSTWNFFEKSTVETYHRMRDVMESSREDSLMSNIVYGVSKVRSSKGRFAFLLESTMNNYHSQQKPCDVMPVGENLDNKGYGIATWIDHPLRHSLNVAVLKLSEIGALHKLEQKWWYDKGKCPNNKDNSGGSGSLTLSHVAGIFHILISGLVLSMMTSCLEYSVQRFLLARTVRKDKKTPAKTRQTPKDDRLREQYRTVYSNTENDEGVATTSQVMTYEPDDGCVTDHTDV